MGRARAPEGRRGVDVAPPRAPGGAPGRAWITHVAADGATRDVDVGVDVEEALSLGPPLREALAGRPAVALAREAAIIDGVAQAPCSSGALVDDRRRRIEVWWSARRRRRGGR
ncbi:MAG: hypothetical protein H6710_11235 [Myxococcales bacterium]|nr:hypothetical protein [Myxococcales bacterium]